MSRLVTPTQPLITYPSGLITSLSLSRDQTHLSISKSDRTIDIYGITYKPRIFTHKKSTLCSLSPANCLSWSFEMYQTGLVLVSGNQDGTVEFFAKRGHWRTECVINVHQCDVVDVVWCEWALVTGSMDNFIAIFQVFEGSDQLHPRVVRMVDTRQGWVTGLAFSPTEIYIQVTFTQNSTCQLSKYSCLSGKLRPLFGFEYEDEEDQEPLDIFKPAVHLGVLYFPMVCSGEGLGSLGALCLKSGELKEVLLPINPDIERTMEQNIATVAKVCLCTDEGLFVGSNSGLLYAPYTALGQLDFLLAFPALETVLVNPTQALAYSKRYASICLCTSSGHVYIISTS